MGVTYRVSSHIIHLTTPYLDVSVCYVDDIYCTGVTHRKSGYVLVPSTHPKSNKLTIDLNACGGIT